MNCALIVKQFSASTSFLLVNYCVSLLIIRINIALIGPYVSELCSKTVFNSFIHNLDSLTCITIILSKKV